MAAAESGVKVMEGVCWHVQAEKTRQTTQALSEWSKRSLSLGCLSLSPAHQCL